VGVRLTLQELVQKKLGKTAGTLACGVCVVRAFPLRTVSMDARFFRGSAQRSDSCFFA
jgi:hypothetical protein